MKKTVSQNWFMDPATYPVMGVICVGISLGVGFSIRKLFCGEIVTPFSSILTLFILKQYVCKFNQVVMYALTKRGRSRSGNSMMCGSWY